MGQRRSCSQNSNIFWPNKIKIQHIKLYDRLKKW
jgi:hypothetical protein